MRFLDLVEVHSNFMPLIFHYQTWNVHQLLPYFVHRCNAGEVCRFYDYVNWCAENYPTILGMKNMS